MFLWHFGIQIQITGDHIPIRLGTQIIVFRVTSAMKVIHFNESIMESQIYCTVMISDHGQTFFFDGVDLKNGTVDEVKWLSLEIYVNGAEMEEPYRIPIYENNSAYSSFDEYELSSKEHP